MRKQELLNLVDNLLESIDNSINYLNSNKTDYNLGIVQGKVDLINSLLPLKYINPSFAFRK